MGNGPDPAMTARLLVDQHGEGAVRVARELEAALTSVGDRASAARWRAIGDDATWILERRVRGAAAPAAVPTAPA